MRDMSWDEYAEKVIQPLFDNMAEGWYAGCKELSESLGFELAPKERCMQQFLWIWADNEMYDWVPQNIESLGMDVTCEGIYEG